MAAIAGHWDGSLFVRSVERLGIMAMPVEVFAHSSKPCFSRWELPATSAI